MAQSFHLKSTVGVVTALTLFMCAVGIAPATEILPSTDTSRDVSTDIDAAIETQPVVYQDTQLIDEGRIQVDNGVVTAPSATEDEFSVALPMESLDQFQIPTTSADEDYSVAVHDEGDGAFRSLIHIPNADSPKEYSFVIEPDYQMSHLEDGGIGVWDQNDNLVGTFSAPWAVDANGRNVRTEYAIDGNRLIQRIYTDGETAFPVVADPFWIPALAVMAHFTRHALTQAAARGISQALIKQVVKNGVKTAGKKGTSVFTQGKGKNRIRVVVANKTGNIITVTKG